MILRTVLTYVGEFDITAVSHQASLQLNMNPVDDTRWTATTRASAPGLPDAAFNSQAFAAFGTGAIEEILFGKRGLGDIPFSASANAATDGVGSENDIVYSMLSSQTDMTSIQGEVGAAHMINFNAASSGDMYRGVLTAPKAARTTSGNSATGFQLGALGANDALFATLHVFAASGTTPTLDVIIESDDSGGFATPTTQLTLTQATGVTSQFLKGATGAIADDWFRAKWTIAGTTPSFTFAVVVGKRTLPS